MLLRSYGWSDGSSHLHLLVSQTFHSDEVQSALSPVRTFPPDYKNAVFLLHFSMFPMNWLIPCGKAETEDPRIARRLSEVQENIVSAYRKESFCPTQKNSTHISFLFLLALRPLSCWWPQGLEPCMRLTSLKLKPSIRLLFRVHGSPTLILPNKSKQCRKRTRFLPVSY